MKRNHSKRPVPGNADPGRPPLVPTTRPVVANVLADALERNFSRLCAGRDPDALRVAHMLESAKQAFDESTHDARKFNCMLKWLMLYAVVICTPKCELDKYFADIKAATSYQLSLGALHSGICISFRNSNSRLLQMLHENTPSHQPVTETLETYCSFLPRAIIFPPIAQDHGI